MEHESTTIIPVAPDRLYGALANAGNLTRFIPPLKSVRRTDSEHVEVTAQYEGHEQHGQAWFAPTTQPGGSNGGRTPIRTTGRMQVEPGGEGSKLTLHLTTSHADDIEEYVASMFESTRSQF